MLTRTLLPHPQFQGSRNKDLITPNDRLGYAHIPNSRTRWTTEDYEIDIEINGLGLREEPLDPADRRTPIILALGDSFTVGFGVQAIDSWPEQMEKLLKDAGLAIRVVNGGVSGYSLRQIRLLAEELVPVLEPRLVVVGINPFGAGRIENPFVFFQGYLVRASRVPYLEPTEGGFLYRRSRFQTGWLASIDEWLNRYFLFGAHILSVASDRFQASDNEGEISTHELVRQLRPLNDELVRISVLCSERGIPLIGLLVNQQEEDGSFRAIEARYNQIVSQFAKERGISLIDPLPEFKRLADGAPSFRFRYDHHWSPRAHRKAAELLSPVVARTIKEKLD